MNWIKRTLYSFTFLLTLVASSIAQPIPRISLWGQKIVPLLTAFDTECTRLDYNGFTDMGIYRVDRYPASADNPERWLVTLVIDDRYKNEPPKEFAQLGQNIYFFYDAVPGRLPVANPSTPEILAYQDELIGDRLYIRPAPKQRYTEHKIKGEIVREEIGRSMKGGYPQYSIWFAFREDGTITQSRPFRD
ncbi:hypothetical protein [Fibrella aquatica]|uniref:hypothetical protein n=1 Tax=Fibrella aquatica TaxID=3242487 RepID=UPI00352275A2